MGADPTLINVPNERRLAKLSRELHGRGNVFCAEDVCRRDILIVAQRVANLITAIEDTTGEAPTKSCLYDSANALLRRGRHGSFKVSKVTPADLPDWLDNTRARYQRVVIAANNPNCWEIKSKDLSVL